MRGEKEVEEDVWWIGCQVEVREEIGEVVMFEFDMERERMEFSGGLLDFLGV